MKGTLKPPSRGGSKKTGIAVTLVTVVFAAIGATFMIIGYHDEVLHWMATTGIAFLVVAALPALVFAFHLINKKIES